MLKQKCSRKLHQLLFIFMNFHAYVIHVTRCDLSYSNSHSSMYLLSPANLILLLLFCTLGHLDTLLIKASKTVGKRQMKMYTSMQKVDVGVLLGLPLCEGEIWVKGQAAISQSSSDTTENFEGRMTLQCCPKRGQKGQVFIFLHQPVIRCKIPWERGVMLSETNLIS